MKISMEAAQHVVEQACVQLQNPGMHRQASSVLLAFRNSPEAIPACKHILEHSASDMARFQAAITLREAALREWPLMSPTDRAALQSYVLQLVLRSTPDGKRTTVINQLIAALVALLKRGWLEQPEQRREFFQAVQQAGDGSSAALQMALFEAMVAEFAPDTASAMHMPWEFHNRCRAIFQAEYLKDLYVLGINIARERAAGSAPDLAVAASAMDLMCVILEWDWRPSDMPAAAAQRMVADAAQVRPHRSWRDVLLDPAATRWLTDAMPRLVAAGSPAAESARRLVVRLAGVSGDIFVPSPAEQRQQQGGGMPSVEGISATVRAAKAAYLGPLLRAVLGWTATSDYAEDQLRDACLAIAAAAPVHTAAGFQAACPPAEGLPGGALGAIAGVTCGAIRDGGLQEDREEVHEITTLLLEAWADLMAGMSQEGSVPQDTAAAAEQVFHALVFGSLQDMAVGATEEAADDDAEEAEAAMAEATLERAAVLGRTAPAASLPLLAGLIAERRAALLQHAASGGDPSVALEQLWWLVRMAGTLLADAGVGETPLPPVPIAAATAAAAAPDADPVARLSRELLDVLALAMDPAARAALSPRLLEAAAWAAARWARTYLMPGEAVSRAMHDAFGCTAGGSETAETLVTLVGTLLGGWAGEVALHRAAVNGVLLGLAQLGPPVTDTLLRSPSWHALLGAFAEHRPEVAGLAAPLHRGLALALALAAAGLRDAEAAQQYVGHMLGAVTRELSGLAERGNLKQLAGQADVQHRLECLLEALRGAAGGVTPSTQAPLFDVLRQLMGPLLALGSAFSGHHPAQLALLKLAGDCVEAHVSYLAAEQAAVLCDWVLALLRNYSASHKGLTGMQASSALRKEEAAEAGRELRALLRLLTNLTQRDLLDFGSAPDGPRVDVAQAVFLGLDIVVPLMSGELLAVPKLARLYFALLSYMMDIWPAHVAELPGQQFDMLMRSLDFGLASSDAEVAGHCLEGLYALAAWDVSRRTEGHTGLANRSAPGDVAKPLLAHFLEGLLRRLLLEAAGRDAIEAAADCLLALILAAPDTFRSIGEGLMAQQQDPGLKAALTASLTRLMTTGVQQSLDRTTRRAFRANLRAFVAEVRSIMRLH